MNRFLVVFLLLLSVVTTRIVAEVTTVAPLRSENAALKQKLEQAKELAEIEAGMPIGVARLEPGNYSRCNNESSFAFVQREADSFRGQGRRLAVFVSSGEIPEHFATMNIDRPANQFRNRR